MRQERFSFIRPNRIFFLFRCDVQIDSVRCVNMCQGHFIVDRHCRAGFGTGKGIQYAATGDVFCVAALVSQVFELFFQFLQIPEPFSHMADVLVQKRIDPVAAFVRDVPEMKENPDFIQCHVERAAVADEQQAFDMGVRIYTIITVCAADSG